MMGALQESTLAAFETLALIEFDSFTTDDAVDLGLVAVHLIREWDLNLAVDVSVRGESMFRAKLKNTGRENDEWLDGKAAVTLAFDAPSLLVKLRHLGSGTPFEERTDVDHAALRAFGGAVPIRSGGVVVGTLTVSGEPDDIDHEVAATALRRYHEQRAGSGVVVDRAPGDGLH